MRALRCIVVDDYAPNLLVIKTLLTLLGCEPLTARSGDECLSILATAEVDAIFSDKNMPGMDGIELLRHVRESEDPNLSEMPFFIVTAEGHGALDRAEELGVTGWIDKPVSKASLAAALCEVDQEMGVDSEGTPDCLHDSSVLCVDDDATCLQIVEHIVRSIDGDPVAMADGASALRFLARVWGDALGFPIDADALVTAAETGDFSSDAVPRDPRQQQGGQQGDHAGAGAERSTSTLSAGPKTMPAPNQPGSAQRRSTRGVDTPNDDDNNNSDNNNGNKDNSNINANSNGTDNHGSHAAAHHRDTAVTHGALPRAVVLDINLPTISGVAVTRMIRLMEQHHPTLPRMHIVIASGSVMESFSGEFTALIDGSIAKPFRRVDVLHALVPLFKVLFRAKTGPDDATADLQHPRKGPGSPNPTRRQPQSASASQQFLRGPADAAPMRTARYPSSQGSDGVIDFAVAASLDPDDIEFVAELVESFLTEARSQCAELGRIAAAAPELDWTTTKRVSHQLAGTAGSVGMARIGRLAATLEEHAKLALEEHAKLALGADGDTAEAQAHDPDTLAISADTLAISAQCAVDLIEELASTTAESAAQWEAGRESGLLREAARNARDDGA